MIYVMNSAVMPAECFGVYTYAPATKAALAEVVRGQHGEWVSCVGYPQNIDLIEAWTGVRIPVSRVEVAFADGDRAIVMRLKRRIADPMTKGQPVGEAPQDWEFAWVTFRRS